MCRDFYRKNVIVYYIDKEIIKNKIWVILKEGNKYLPSTSYMLQFFTLPNNHVNTIVLILQMKKQSCQDIQNFKPLS